MHASRVENISESFCQGRLARTGNILDQCMAAAQQCNRRAVDRFCVANNCALDSVANGTGQRRDLLNTGRSELSGSFVQRFAPAVRDVDA